MNYNNKKNLVILFFLTEFFSDDYVCCFNLTCYVIFLHFFQCLHDNWVQMKIQRKNIYFSFYCDKQNNFVNVNNLLKTYVLLFFQFCCDFNFDWFQQWEKLLMRLISHYNSVNESWFYHYHVHLSDLNQEKASNEFCDFEQCIDLIFHFLHDFI